MSDGVLRALPSTTSRERRRNRIRAPFGDEDIPIVFAGSGGRELFCRRLGSVRRTAFLYDERMQLHKNEWHSSYPERPERQSAVFQRCEDYGILSRCLLLTAEPALDYTLLYMHINSYISKVLETESMGNEDRKALANTLDSAFFNQHTALAARLAVGSLVQAVELVHRGDVRNAFCLVRPPGHHAMEDEACGFCVFNNVAIAAQYAFDKFDYNRILIVDWDVHHGQATQYAFYDSSRVLYISVHRYDNQRFWPQLRESNFDFIGSGRGRGFNINVPLNEDKLGDADYLAVFHQLILPVAFEFDPDFVFISAGYDCAYGCPLGQMEVSPPLFAHLTHKLMCLAEGRLVIALEGGYYLDSLAESAAHTVAALLGDPPPSLDILGEVSPSVLKSISDCVSVLRSRWRCLQIFQVLEPVSMADSTELPDRSWSLIKVPTTDPEDHIHDPDEKARIDHWLSRVKLHHPVARPRPDYITCLVYDSRMENHKNEDDRTHPETPHRIRRAYELLDEYGIARRCKRVEARFASRSELLRVHTEEYVDRIAATAGLDQSVLNEMADDIDSVYFSRHTYDCARLAAGSVLAVVDEVCTGRTLNGVAVVRPPGHHALADRSMGFCFFNNVAVGARHAQQVYGLDRIAIVDWDVHHGNGTAKIFEKDPTVLYISVHRYDDGRFFPSIPAASPSACGVDEGLGYTVQVGWNGRHVRDGEYIAVFTHLILPILYEFRPQLILVSAGYDAVRGDRLGGLSVSTECFAHLTHLLLPAAYLNSPDASEHLAFPTHSSEFSIQQHSPQNGKSSVFSGGLILVLEGGYHMSATAEALCHSVASLLGDSCPRLAVGISPTEKGCKAIRKGLHIHQQHWKSIQGYGPVRSHVVPSDNLSHVPNSPDSGVHPAVAFTGQLEALLQSRLQEMSLNDDAPPRLDSPVQQIVQPSSASVSLAVSNPIGLGSVSASLPTRALATRIPVATEHAAETLQDSGTDLLSSHLSANGGQAASTSIVPSSSVVENQALLVDEVSRLNVSSPFTGLSDPSSLTSELSVSPHHRPMQADEPGAAGSSDNRTEAPVGNTSDITGNQVVGIASLQDLMHVCSLGTEDIHAFFGLASTHQLPERLFAVIPLTWCPHLTAIRNNPDWVPDVHEVCRYCDHRAENWVCLTCYAVYCGRYANSHMLNHFTSDRHPLVLSFADLSSWCYECEAYVHNEVLFDVKRTAHRAKFGMDSPRT